MKKNISYLIAIAFCLLAVTNCDSIKNVSHKSPCIYGDQSRNNSYLRVDATNSLFSEVSGNGYEEGIVSTVKTFDHKEVDATPLVEFPQPDNYADCRTSKIELVKSEFTDESSYGWYTYAITIDTAVVTDTGGCLVWIKNASSKETISIINYKYSIDK